MARISYIFVAIALSFSASVLGLTDTTYEISSSAPGYKVHGHVDKTKSGLQIPLSLNGKAPNTFGKTIKDLVVDVEYETKDRLHVKASGHFWKLFYLTLSFRFLIKQRSKPLCLIRLLVWSVPRSLLLLQMTETMILNTLPSLLVSKSFVKVTRLSFLILRTFLWYLKINILNCLPRSLMMPISMVLVKLLPLLNVLLFYANIYGSHPYYMEVREGKAHSALLLSAHGMDVITTEGRITYKVIGGILDFYFFVPKSGSPNDVTVAYTDLVGKPLMPSHWMLGWHHCRYGYKNIDQVETVVKRYKEANIPLQTAWVDIDYMEETKDFTADQKNFPLDRMIDFGKDLHKHGQNYVMMVDPAISANTSYSPYNRGIELDVFIKNPDGSDYIGAVWPGYTTFPDFTHPNISKYWDKEIADWVNLIGLDGLWIDMNEPASFCLGSCGTGKVNAGKQPYRWTLPQEEQGANHAKQEDALIAMGNPKGEDRNLLYPKYAINNGGGNLSELTVATTALHYGDVPHYDIHNIYGHSESYVTRQALIKNQKDIRPFILTRSTYVGTGKYAGHWTGDNHSLWSYLKNSLANVFNMHMFGITYSGADVCGFNQNTTEELCTRWMEIGAFYTFARNHNAIDQADQEPYLWNSTTEASRKALAARYAMLPYYYTLHEESNRLGTAVWRPLIFEYPHHNEFANNDVQVLVGSDVLLSPVLNEGDTTVVAQFPSKSIWYDWYTLETAVDNKSDKSQKVTLDAPLTHIPIHVRGGSIIPTKTPKYTVGETFATDYKLIIALDHNNEASGRLYIDNGESLHVKSSSDIKFSYKHGQLKASGKFGYKKPEKLASVTIVGKAATQFKHARINEKSYKLSHDNKNTVVLEDISISLTKSFTIKFD